MNLTDFATFRVAASDLNGQMRGKRLPARAAAKLDSGGVRMPLSALNVDISGADIADSPLVFETGDADGALYPTGRGPLPMPWLDAPSALVPMWMFTEGGRPFDGDPRHALARGLDRFAARGWRVKAATEMEFYLVDDTGDTPGPPVSPVSGRPLRGQAILSVRQLDAFDAFFTDLYNACDAMEIPVQSLISEAGIGQFEVTLDHRDALDAADDAWLFKTLARGMARKHGFAATFMAKPYEDDAGNGMHVHFSVLDESGANVFDDGGPAGTGTLRHAIAGCLEAMRDSTLLFAPHANSYERLVPSAHAPTGVAWAYENRTAAIRVPSGASAARRIEHRVAGGDINPYLMLAAVLGAAMNGIEDTVEPPAPITGNAYDQDLDQLPGTWAEATDIFEKSPVMKRIFAPALVRNLVMTKRQEMRLVAGTSPEAMLGLCLEAV